MDLKQFLLEKVPLFYTFPEKQLDYFISASTVTTFEKHEAIIEFGEKCEFLGILIEGEAEIALTDDRGEKHNIANLGPGDVFGEMSLMTGDKTTADVIGKIRCKVLLIPQSIFLSKIIIHPPAIKYLSRVIAERLKKFPYDEQVNEISARAFQKSGDPYGFKLKSRTPMKLLAINSSEGWIRFRIFDTSDETMKALGRIEGIGTETRSYWITSQGKEFSGTIKGMTHREALKEITQIICSPENGMIHSLEEISAVGHRVVHGGKINGSSLIDKNLLEQIDHLSELAPLHNPVNLETIREAMEIFPSAPHVAVFDTAFHQTIPSYAHLYALPYEYKTKYNIRKYGFHGMSHLYAALKASEYLKTPFNSQEIITCHLGSGTSLCAIDHGRSVDTSMGFTPSDGIPMATRSGSLDPGILIHLMKKEKFSPEALEELINKKSGLLGLSGISSDLIEIENLATQEGNNQAILAFKTYAYSIRKKIGAYMAAMGGLDVLVFTGTRGLKSPLVRSLATQGLQCMGIKIDKEKNLSAEENVYEISADDSLVKVLVVPNEEERMIARETLKVLEQEYIEEIIRSQESQAIPLEVSAHHIHLSREHVEILFGKGYQLTVKAELSQPGQFACNETVLLIGPKGSIERVRVLGPERSETQIEIAKTEQFKLGIQPPIRQSGDLDGTPGVTVQGPAGTIILEKGVICAMRHIHMHPEDALRYGLRDKDMVRVRVEGDRELIFGDVIIRVNPSYKLAMHIDTDEANAANIQTGVLGFIDSIQSRG